MSNQEAVQAIFAAGPCFVPRRQRRANGANPTPEQLAGHLTRNCELDPATGCWAWLRSRSRQGYGTLRLNGRTERTHRLALQLSSGHDGNGLFALHSCDVPACINPAHLRWGTHAENMADRVSRGRRRADFQHGERNHQAKLTEATVGEIRAMLAAGESQTSIGRCFGVGRTTITAIARGKNWTSTAAPQSPQSPRETQTGEQGA